MHDMTTGARAELPGGGVEEEAELAKTRQRVLRVLLDGPREGMHAWGDYGIAERLPGRQQALLGLVLQELETEGVVSVQETCYRGRTGAKFVLTDPLSVVTEDGARKRDELGRYCQ